MKQNIFKLLMSFALLLLGTQAQALLITADSPLSPSLIPTCADTDTACIEALNSTNTNLINTYLESVYGLRQYKSDFLAGELGDIGVEDDGLLTGSYETAFELDTVSGEPSGATITYTGGVDGSIMDCPNCYLLVKDGNKADPRWYFYDLDFLSSTGTWDGMETITLKGFWDGLDADGKEVPGSISHIAFYGSVRVPEPSILALLGLGLIGMAASRRKVR